MRAITKAPQTTANTFTRLYNHRNRAKTKNGSNRWRLMGLISMFDLAPSALARAGGVSPAYVSRILNEADSLVGSAEFYHRLNSALGRLIEERHCQFFRVAPVAVRSIERAVRDGGKGTVQTFAESNQLEAG